MLSKVSSKQKKKKKELRSVGLPTLTNASFLFSEVYNKKIGVAGFELT
jgi:hypothetical protein